MWILFCELKFLLCSNDKLKAQQWDVPACSDKEKENKKDQPGCVMQNWYCVVKPRQLQNVREFLSIPWLEKEKNHLTQCQLKDRENDFTSITFGFQFEVQFLSKQPLTTWQVWGCKTSQNLHLNFIKMHKVYTTFIFFKKNHFM